MTTISRQALFTYVATFLLGAALSFAFAPYGIFPLAILAPAGLLALLQNASPKRSFALGYLFGLGLFGAGTYWIYISIHLFGDVGELLSGFITLLFVGLMALFPATVCYVTNRYFATLTTLKQIYVFPAIWVIGEWVRSWMFTGFPWLFLGYSQTNSPLKGYAPIFSVYGVSLAVIMSSGLLLTAFNFFKQHRRRAMYNSLLALAGIWLLGAFLTFLHWTKPADSPLTVSLVQGNIPQTLKWSPEHLQLSLERYRQLTDALWKKDTLIIWPEAAVPLPLHAAGGYIEALDKKAKATHTSLILGIPIQNNDATGYYNGIVTLGAHQSVYLKRRLVPFGEYIPFAAVFSRFFHFMQIPMANTVSGNMNQPPLTMNGVKIHTSICYEVAFPELILTRDDSPAVLLTLTNDAWFGESSAQAQHLQMAQMRALELKRPLIFASNDGITAVIDANGNVESAAPAHQIAVLTQPVQAMSGQTPWMRFGMDPILFILIYLIYYPIRLLRLQAKTANAQTALSQQHQ